MTTQNQPDTGETGTALATTAKVKTGSVGNLNSAKSGTAIVRTMPDSELPRRYRFINHKCRQFRRELEEAVINQCGEITVAAASWINAAATHEKNRQFCAARIRYYLGRDNPEETVILALTTAVGKEVDARSRCIDKLNLPISRESDVWTDLYRIPSISAAPAAASDAPADAADTQAVPGGVTET